MILSKVPFFSQTDNVNHPGGTCNITSVAMVMAYWKVVGDGSGKQLEDQLYEYAKANRLVIGSPYDMAKLFTWKGMNDHFRTSNVDWIQYVKKEIDAGRPCIIHTQFTPAGHIVVIAGYENNHLVCHDPYGEFSGVYGKWAGTNHSNPVGRFVHYSYDMMDHFSNIGGTVWLHSGIVRPGYTHV